MLASGGTTAAGGAGGGGTGGGPCTAPLGAIASGYFPCPNDYASAEQWPATCTLGHAYLGSCNGFLVFLVSVYESGKECYYDPVSHALVGAVAQADIPVYCSGTSNTIAGGSYPSACPLSSLTDLGECMPATGGRGPGTGGTGGMGGVPASGGTTATGGRTTCSWNQPCATGLCVGDYCGLGTCIVDGRDCTGSLIDYCGCDGVSFQDSSTCPKRPYAYPGACGQGPNCDQREVLCEMTTPTCGPWQVPRVVGNCYDGTCISINQCSCTAAEECPDSRNYTCLLSLKRCSPYLL